MRWTGAKADPGALGLLTVAMSVLAGLAAARQASPVSVSGRAPRAPSGSWSPPCCATARSGGFWYLPGPLLLVAGTLCVDSWRDTAVETTRNWSRCLLSALGAGELLMAAGTAPTLLTAGAVGGIALMTAS